MLAHNFAPSAREIVLDTETTGFDPLSGHRVVEIGAVELVDHVPADAVAVHGLTAEFLADKPLFDHVADEFLAFVGDAPLVAHNAGFDIVFCLAAAVISSDACCLLTTLRWQPMHWYRDTSKVWFGGPTLLHRVLIGLGHLAKPVVLRRDQRNAGIDQSLLRVEYVERSALTHPGLFAHAIESHGARPHQSY